MMTDSKTTETTEGVRESEEARWLPDVTDDEHGRHVADPYRHMPLIGMPHVLVLMLGMILGVLLVSWPFIMQSDIVRADAEVAEEIDSETERMTQEEHDMRLLSAQRSNALVSGWGNWPSSVDNAGMAGDDAGTGDIPTPSPDAMDSWAEGMFDASRPLEVADGLIGWAHLSTGRKVAISDREAPRPDAQNLLRREKWSSLPVGGHGTFCVLSLAEGDLSPIVRDDLLGMREGDAITLHVLGDAYSYEVSSVVSGFQSEIVGTLTADKDEDRLAILVDKDTSGMVTAILANRRRYEMASDDLSSPAIEVAKGQMVAGIAGGVISSLLFALVWIPGRRSAKGTAHGEGASSDGGSSGEEEPPDGE